MNDRAAAADAQVKAYERQAANGFTPEVLSGASQRGGPSPMRRRLSLVLCPIKPVTFVFAAPATLFSKKLLFFK
ncbi:hypothetical protein TKWG_24190 [Advenella kashmirensis WT001]|uniref:Uncharacterized protein n=1 Tax=Advenella kashmirensis (strain DSM 17095 / LMG 22695 / WT001) TaxID=1036672 RepID=I3UHC1_ADVKW|nr:hypothetical protein [Advenella kashmirensis]AFK64409.1 hypothetical protein TKWG_24190 [Advenella kashmirensis WT001]